MITETQRQIITGLRQGLKLSDLKPKPEDIDQLIAAGWLVLTGVENEYLVSKALF
ncbi:hypothetical protein [Anabaena azotica]|uniref:Uncharacterized protein n=1 Tax=Anabaena azotica FACHB-119 TaxID=947527 RepID=A0ABR8D9K4_9NOST|nr:hypothetical protein [Anabaena azotica]MBD2503880.1 hypothetical protein [Anabaena azotica FACHB-119]MBD2503973.1 hypothetical protein [Anabaena azotica FACHB-119]